MSTIAATGPRGIVPIVYPESDGKPVAESTKQLRWITLLYDNLRAQFADRPDVFVAGDNFWYPVEGEPAQVLAPDVYVVFGRPKGDRGSYKQWLEDDVPLTVAFEVRSPGNTDDEMAKKFYFYDDHGVEVYYVYDPETNRLEVFVRGLATFRQVHDIASYASRRMGIRFEMTKPEMTVYGRDGERFIDFTESKAETRVERAQKDEAKREADDAKREADESKRQAEDAKREADESKRQAEDAKREADEADRRTGKAERQAEAAIARAARLVGLGRKARRGQASAEEVAELERLEDEATSA